MHITLTEQGLKNLEEKRIYTSVDGSRRLHPGELIHFDEATLAAPYSAILRGVIYPRLGSFSYTQSQLPETMSIGRYCSIGHGLGIVGGNHPTDYLSTSSFSYDANLAIHAKCLEDFQVENFTRYGLKLSRPNRHDLPKIGNDVWFGDSVVLARGIVLGDGCIIAANSVVTKSVPPYAIVGGNPARIIRMRFDDATIERLLLSQWWNYKFTDFSEMNYNNVNLFLDKFEAAAANGAISAFPEAQTKLLDLLVD